MMESRDLAKMFREQAVSYGVNDIGLQGLIAAIVGNVPDETLNYLSSTSLRELSQLTMEELTKLKGIGRVGATALTAAFELGRRLTKAPAEKKPYIKSPEDAAALLMEEMRFLDREHFKVLLLNTKNQVITLEIVSIGTLNSSAVHPRELFKSAIRKSAAAVVLVHNHPSGDPSPSREDMDVTRRLKEAGEIMGIEVLDHIIIGDGKFISFKAKGML